MSYAELDRLASACAAGLARRGVGEGSVVALVLPTGPEYVVLYAALARLGAVTAGISERFAKPERAAVIERLAPDVVLTSDDYSQLGQRKVSPPTLPYDQDRPVAVVFTSGTTGTPRGATFYGRQLAAITAMDVGDDWGGGDPLVVATGLPHVGFMTKLPGHLQRGARMHLLARWRAADVLRTVVDNRIPVIGAVAAQVALLMRLPDFDSQDLSACARPHRRRRTVPTRARARSARAVRRGVLDPLLVDRVRWLGTMTAFDAPDDEALYTVGRPRPGTALDIRDGEVCLRGAHVMSGYWRDDAATADVLRDGWLHTGDLGFLDEAGCLQLTGRKSDAYIRGGYNVHPGEVEAVLRSHPALADVAVVPRPDPVMGEIGVAVVVPRDPDKPPTVNDLREYAAPQLAAYKLPEAIRIVDALPLTAMDKVDRRTLIAFSSG